MIRFLFFLPPESPDTFPLQHAKQSNLFLPLITTRHFLCLLGPIKVLQFTTLRTFYSDSSGYQLRTGTEQQIRANSKAVLGHETSEDCDCRKECSYDILRDDCWHTTPGNIQNKTHYDEFLGWLTGFEVWYESSFFLLLISSCENVIPCHLTKSINVWLAL